MTQNEDAHKNPEILQMSFSQYEHVHDIPMEFGKLFY